MELELKKCYFHRKFNEKKIIILRPVAFHFRYSFCRSRMGSDRQKILSWCGRCALLFILHIFNENSEFNKSDSQKEKKITQFWSNLESKDYFGNLNFTALQLSSTSGGLMSDYV